MSMLQDNVLLSASNEPLLMDFGLSHKYLTSNTSSGNGALRWNAPEIINQTVQYANAKTDIWALGMTIFVRRHYRNIWAYLTHMILGASY